MDILFKHKQNEVELIIGISGKIYFKTEITTRERLRETFHNDKKINSSGRLDNHNVYVHNDLQNT